jgi:SAM-dependent methyltransferase
MLKPGPDRFGPEQEEAGAREPFEDAELYDFEYRRRRADVTFYRRLAVDRMNFGRPGPILDLACGTGRLTIPLLRDGHVVVGVDRSRSMLARAAQRVQRLSATPRSRAALVRADLRRFAFDRTFALAIAAFHSVQHLVSNKDLLRFLYNVRASLGPGGRLAFDVLPPDPTWIARDPERRWGRTVFRHPGTRQRFVYTTNHVFDPHRRALHIRVYYQPIDERGEPSGPEQVVRLCHRQLFPTEVEALLNRAGFRLIGTFGGFDARALDREDPSLSDEHIYVARVT